MPIPNPLGVHALVWVGDNTGPAVADAVSRTAAAGYDLLEFALHDLENLDTTATRALLVEHGLAAACSRGLTHDADVSSTDPAVVERGAALLRASLSATPRSAPPCSPGRSTARSARGRGRWTRSGGATSSGCCGSCPPRPRRSG